MTTLIPPPPAHAPHGEPDMDALLDMLEERAADPPSVTARTRSIAAAAAPRAAEAARRLANGASVTVLLVLVSLTAALVVAGEIAARAVVACDLPGRARTAARWSARWSAGTVLAARRLPGTVRACAGSTREWARSVWADHVQTWPARAAQWALGPRGILTARHAVPTLPDGYRR